MITFKAYRLLENKAPHEVINLYINRLHIFYFFFSSLCTGFLHVPKKTATTPTPSTLTPLGFLKMLPAAQDLQGERTLVGPLPFVN